MEAHNRRQDESREHGPSKDGSPEPESATPLEENHAVGTIVVKIGGSTLGSHDTTLVDLVKLQREGVNPVVVHGGGKIISEWMEKQGVRPRFVRGLRVTDEPSLDIVIAVLTGLINKSIVASLVRLGARVMGISGADDGMLQAEIKEPELGLVGKVVKVNPDPVKAVLDAGCIPVIAPVAIRVPASDEAGPSMLNINADTAAGEIASALGADRLVFLTDVEGVLDTSRRLIPRLTERQAEGLIHSKVAAGGMVPKLEACLTALQSVSMAQIVDGRRPLALVETLSGKRLGTRIG
ncbi:MAG: acetylglutamate kinase [Chloroflexi bacterium]|nr:acetylglutamate kinase [Chloroflexota bacterium]